MLINRSTLIKTVGFSVLLTTVSAVWLLSVALLPGAVDATVSVERVAYEEQLQNAKAEYPAAPQTEF